MGKEKTNPQVNTVNNKRLVPLGSGDFLVSEFLIKTIKENFNYNEKLVEFYHGSLVNMEKDKIFLRKLSKGKIIVVLKDNGYINSGKKAMATGENLLLSMEMGYAIKKGDFFIDGHKVRVPGTNAQDKLNESFKMLEKSLDNTFNNTVDNENPKDKARKFAVFARNELIEKIKERAMELNILNELSSDEIEEAAFTWFNRFIALRFMEVNGYLKEKNIFKFQLNVDRNTKEKTFKDGIIKLCKEYEDILPGIFKGDLSLFPDHLTSEKSFISRMVTDIEKEQWLNSVEIIGWLYQYYNCEKKREIFKELKKKKHINGKDLPIATQLFTPLWLAKYMVQNSIGVLWIDHLSDLGSHACLEKVSVLKEKWEFLEDRGPGENLISSLEEIKILDPAAGSGNTLSCAFDLLMDLYLLEGYPSWQATDLIVESNLHALEVDKRAAQMCYFTLMMKGRQYDDDFFKRPHKVNVFEIENTKAYPNAKEIGSILKIHSDEKKPWQGALLEKYHVVVTNPPYMTMYNMSENLVNYVKENYEDSKHDLFAVFMEKSFQLTKDNGFVAMVTQHSWMFLECYRELRNKLLSKEIRSLIHLGTRAFDEILGDVVQTVAFVFSNKTCEHNKGSYKRLVKGSSEQEKIQEFFKEENRFIVDQNIFRRIPQMPISYWQKENFFKAFEGTFLRDFYETKKGMFTGDNEYFLRKWYEVPEESIGKDFLPYNKGGRFRRWYGCNDTVVKWFNKGAEIKNFKGSGNINESWFYKPCISWNLVSSEEFGCRIVEEGAVMGDASPICLIRPEDPNFYYLLGYLNSKVARSFMEALNPTMNYPSGVVSALPVRLLNIKDHHRKYIEEKVKENIRLEKENWDSYETSRDFKENPLMKYIREIKESSFLASNSSMDTFSILEEAYERYKKDTNERFFKVKKNQEDINEFFIKDFGLSDEPFEHMRNVTMTYVCDSKDKVPEELKGSRYVKYMEDVFVDFISYIVGVFLGRFNILEKDIEKYQKGNKVWHLCKGEFRQSGYTLEEELLDNIKDENGLLFIKKALGGGPFKDPKKVIYNYFSVKFYRNHLKTYAHRPIYWQLDSGKNKGFRAIVRYDMLDESLLKKVESEMIPLSILNCQREMADILKDLDDPKVKKTKRGILEKKLGKLREQEKELYLFKEKVSEILKRGFSIDYSLGVLENYNKFSEIFSKI